MASAPPLIPREILFGNPERVLPGVSPDGRSLSYVAPVDGVLNVWVGPVDGEAQPLTDDRERGVRQYFWAHDGRHLLYLQDKGGDENWRLYAVELTTRSVRDLTPFDGVQAQVVEVSKHHPDLILVGLNRDRPELHDVYQLELSTGRLEKVVDNPGFVGWLADDQLRVRAGLAPTADGGSMIMVRDLEAEAEWRVLLTAGQEDALSTAPLGFSADGEGLYAMSSVGANAGRLVILPLDGGEAEVLAEDPRYDVSRVVDHPDTHHPQLVGFMRDRLDWEVLDPEVGDDLALLQKLHPGDLDVVDRDDADAVWLVAFTADDGPVSYFAYDRENRQARFLFHHQPALADYELAPMEPFSFTARDGLEIHGYLSFPPGGERSQLPTVLDVHGGPWVRDTWGLDPEAQWLASRGYLCVQVNYRGSTGYGKDFVNAGDREWAGRMHDDLVDAVEWVVDQGYADPARVGIFGGSYGGYAALVGATFTPDVFACAVDIVGPSSLQTLIESIPPYWAPLVAQFHTRVGNPETEPELLWSRSPLSRVDDIRIPLLIAQGANDPRVKQAESEQIVAALREKGIDHEYLLFEDEGHGFAKPENRLRFFAAAESFLARHLGGRCETPTSAST
ncbi:MAG TPA: S9 family peptidase [Acidimicrobiales bacterium]|nr:S9 family peptidase [Acidimicrobiales bacterium]